MEFFRDTSSSLSIFQLSSCRGMANRSAFLPNAEQHKYYASLADHESWPGRLRRLRWEDLMLERPPQPRPQCGDDCVIAYGCGFDYDYLFCPVCRYGRELLTSTNPLIHIRTHEKEAPSEPRKMTGANQSFGC